MQGRLRGQQCRYPMGNPVGVELGADADAEALSLGMTFDETAPVAQEALREVLKAWRVAVREVAKRDHGEIIETPEMPSSASPAAKTNLTELSDVLPK